MLLASSSKDASVAVLVMRYDLTIVGHVVLDYISRRNTVRGPRLGGPCVYAGLAAHALEASVLAVSKVGPDFQSSWFPWLRARGIDTSRIQVTTTNTTSFRINYHGEKRTLKVTSVCEAFRREDLSNLPSSSAVHIGPVLNELPETLAVRLVKSGATVGLDSQGYLRELSPSGTVRMRNWNCPALMKKLTVLKISEYELSGIAGTDRSVGRLSKLGSEIVLLTRGAKGITVWSKHNGTFHVPPYPSPVKDPTGAGDVRLGAFLVTWVRTGDLLWSASVGSAASSFKVAKIGPVLFGSRGQIERRAMRILDETVRI